MRDRIVYFCGFCGHESDQPEDSCTKCGVKHPLKMWRKLVDEEPPSKEAAA